MYNFDELKSIIPTLENEGICNSFPYILRGMEKEGLRQTSDGQLAQTEHPKALGSALTNKFITTDYSEALIEFITPVFKEAAELQTFLTDLHSFARKNLPAGESFWCHSMPCILTAEEDIPIANYGSSNIGQMKHIYRHGLAWRYTRRMQTIAGIHFNFSYPDEFWKFLHEREKSDLSLKDFKSVRYFDLIRNFKRHVWLLFYFTGSSPALCKSFLTGQNHELQSFDECTAYMPYATSLRMSDLGYTNNEQQQLNVSFNSIEEYTSSLSKAIETPSEEFKKIGVKVDGVYRQLNDNILQIENEFYNIIRPKRTTKSGEKPTTALRERGVEYLEIRMLDINPFEKTGISSEQIHFLDVFMLSCLLSPSPSITPEENTKIRENQEKAILEGRDPNLKIHCEDSQESFKGIAEKCLQNLAVTAELLDKNFKTSAYSASIQSAQETLQDSRKTPSGKILEEMKKGTCSYYPFARAISAQHNKDFLEHAIPEDQLNVFVQEAESSLERQKELEASDSVSFDEFLNDYFSRK